jgi:hypothetical protein
MSNVSAISRQEQITFDEMALKLVFAASPLSMQH